MERARTVFFGSGPFAVPILEAVVGCPELALVAVVTAPPRPAGRHADTTPTAVALGAARLGVPVVAPDRLADPAFVERLERLRPDVGILADYGKLLPSVVLDLPAHGILNLHPSLLPRHRGATPIPAALLAGDRESGVSLFRMDPGLDTGPLVAVDRAAMRPDEDAPGAEALLSGLAAGLLARTIGPYLRGEVVPRAQSDEGVTLSRPLTREDGRLDPGLPAADLERRVRAYRPWPGTFIDLPDGRLAILRAAVGEGSRSDLPGTLVEDGPGVAIATVDGRLRLTEVRPAGGRAMDAAAYRRGRPDIVGARVG